MSTPAGLGRKEPSVASPLPLSLHGAATSAADPPAITAPARTTGAAHFIVERRIIIELLGVGCLSPENFSNEPEPKMRSL